MNPWEVSMTTCHLRQRASLGRRAVDSRLQPPLGTRWAQPTRRRLRSLSAANTYKCVDDTLYFGAHCREVGKSE